MDCDSNLGVESGFKTSQLISWKRSQMGAVSCHLLSYAVASRTITTISADRRGINEMSNKAKGSGPHLRMFPFEAVRDRLPAVLTS